MNKITNRRGELTSKEIVGIVILIISFVVILIFFFFLNPKDEVTKESCRNSVLLRANEFGKSVKLQCRTQEVCISNGRECISVGRDSVTYKVATKEELYDTLSTLMTDCWWMMGEGKVDYAPKGYGITETYCNMCNTIRFDENLRNNNELNKVNMREFYIFMSQKQASNGQSVLEYLYKAKSLDGIQQTILANTEGQVDIYNENVDLSENKEYALVTSITKPGYGSAIIAGSVGVAAGITIGVLTMNPPAGAVAFFTTLKWGSSLFGVPISAKSGGLVGWATGLFITDGNQRYLPPTLYPFDSQAINGLQCKEFTSRAD